MTAIAGTISRPAVGPFRAMGAYLALELRRAVRNRRYLIFAVGFPVVFYLLYTGVLLGKNAPADPAWNAFFMVSMAAYGMIGASLVQRAADRPGADERLDPPAPDHATAGGRVGRLEARRSPT